jgi:hypothetical protein
MPPQPPRRHRWLPRAPTRCRPAIAALFGDHAQAFQSISVQAARFHDQFVQALHAGTASYASAETGRPLIGNGANGGTGGLLLGLDGVNGLT